MSGTPSTSKSRRDHFLAPLFMLSFLSLRAWAISDANAATATIEALPGAHGSIAELNLSPAPLPIEPREDNNKEKQLPHASLSGSFGHPGWSLLYVVAGPSHPEGYQPIEVDPKSGEFRVWIPLRSPKTYLKILAIDPRGNVTEQEVLVTYSPPPGSVQPAAIAAASPKPAHGPGRFTMGAGTTYIAYRESGVSDFTELAITAKAAANLTLTDHWDVGASGYMTLLPLSRNSDSMVRFLGLNIRAGYHIPLGTSPWTLIVAGGGYFTTMFVSNNQFGFQNMEGPQLFPVLQRSLSHGRSATAYLKFSPINQSALALSLVSHELAGGGAFQFPLGNSGKTLSLTADMASLHLEIAGIQIDSTSFTLGMALGF